MAELIKAGQIREGNGVKFQVIEVEGNRTQIEIISDKNGCYLPGKKLNIKTDSIDGVFDIVDVKVVRVPEWVLKRADFICFGNHDSYLCEVVTETEKAVLVRYGIDEECWCPKSVLK